MNLGGGTIVVLHPVLWLKLTLFNSTFKACEVVLHPVLWLKLTFSDGLGGV